MKNLVFATNNSHKLSEVRAILEPNFKIISLKELNFSDDIPETAKTLEGNALLKAKYIYEKYGMECFADDTGLEIEALNGDPGVYSARFAGVENDAKKNMQKVMRLMTGIQNRNACFRTVIAFIRHSEIIYFEGKINGVIAVDAQGDNGFGYDPVFIPEGYSQSFAQLSAETKNKISHRAIAVNKLVEYLLRNELQ